MRIIDCFPYNGELVAEYRIKYLYDTVDEFVIVEAWQTHSGKQKEFLFIEKNKELFEPYHDKITFLVIDEFPPMSAEWAANTSHTWMAPEAYESWWREMYQREKIGRYLSTQQQQKGPFIALCSDADEIPRADVMQFASRMYSQFHETPVYLEMMFFYYNFRWTKRSKWYCAYMFSDIWLQTNGAHALNHARVGLPKTRLLPNAGWHCSYFASKADLRRKLASFAHRECDKDAFKTDEFLDGCLTKGLDIVGRGGDEDCSIYLDNASMLPPWWEELQYTLEECQLK